MSFQCRDIICHPFLILKLQFQTIDRLIKALCIRFPLQHAGKDRDLRYLVILQYFPVEAMAVVQLLYGLRRP